MQIPGSDTIPDESVSVEGRDGGVELRNLKLKTLSRCIFFFFWLCQVLVVACGIFTLALRLLSGIVCGMQA